MLSSATLTSWLPDPTHTVTDACQWAKLWFYHGQPSFPHNGSEACRKELRDWSDDTCREADFAWQAQYFGLWSRDVTTKMFQKMSFSKSQKPYRALVIGEYCLKSIRDP